jgi:hypothetical protein
MMFLPAPNTYWENTGLEDAFFAGTEVENGNWISNVLSKLF